MTVSPLLHGKTYPPHKITFILPGQTTSRCYGCGVSYLLAGTPEDEAGTVKNTQLFCEQPTDYGDDTKRRIISLLCQLVSAFFLDIQQFEIRSIGPSHAWTV